MKSGSSAPRAFRANEFYNFDAKVLCWEVSGVAFESAHSLFKA
jgi:hypothetical protein